MYELVYKKNLLKWGRKVTQKRDKLEFLIINYKPLCGNQSQIVF